MTTKIKGCATPEGTKNYSEKFQQANSKGHFRSAQGLFFSSLGLGSYLGDPTEEHDSLYEETALAALRQGINVLDTAANYRCQRSERVFGRALAKATQGNSISRQEVVICTKGGFLPFDGEVPANPGDFFKSTYVDTGVIKEEDIVQGCQVITSEYLDHQLSKSLENLQVETIDVYYIHNPEMQLSVMKPNDFYERLVQIFQWAEAKVKEGKIQFYGTATWNGYRVGIEAADYLSLEQMSIAARQAVGTENHFKFVQLPFNLAMPEAWVMQNQSFGAQALPVLQVAKRLGISVIGSASLLQAQLTGPFPEFLEKHFEGIEKSSQKSLQFSRSVPGITTSLVGMKSADHLHENLAVTEIEPFSEEKLIGMFSREG